MTHYAPCYDPPLTVESLEEHRAKTFASTDQEQFLHVGHFVSWYASAEFGLTLLLHRFTGHQHPIAFQILTKGMDAKLKSSRLLEAVEAVGWAVESGLLKRLDHFGKRLVSLRNSLVHSHLYWPKDGDLEMTGIGNPPTYNSTSWNAPPPRKIPGLELYERGSWLNLFAQDLISALNAIPTPMKRGGVLGTGNYLSSLPTGDRPSPQTQARRANVGMRAQKNPSPKK